MEDTCATVPVLAGFLEREVFLVKRKWDQKVAGCSGSGSPVVGGFIFDGRFGGH